MERLNFIGFSIIIIVGCWPAGRLAGVKQYPGDTYNTNLADFLILSKGNKRVFLKQRAISDR